MKMPGSLLVGFQFLGAGLSCYAALRAGPPVNFIYLTIAGFGALIGLYTLAFNRIGNFNITPHLKEGASLITSGPYRFIRHPMYVSVILCLLGISLQAGTALGWSGFVVSSIAMVAKANIEEKILQRAFSDYTDYQQQTKRFLPFVY